MNTFDSYTKNIICSYLTEQSTQSGAGTPPKQRTPEEQQKKSQMIRYGRTGVPSGWDVENQAMWWNHRNMVEKMLEGITAGGIANVTGLVGKGMDLAKYGLFGSRPAGAPKSPYEIGFDVVTGAMNKAGQAMAAPAEYALKQVARTAMARLYLGEDDDIAEAINKSIGELGLGEGLGIMGAPSEAGSKIFNLAYSLIDPTTYGGSTQGFLAKGRLGETGIRQAQQIGKIAILGKDPFEYALTRMGAKDASDAISRQATTNVGAVGTLGGSLENLRRMGIAK